MLDDAFPFPPSRSVAGRPKSSVGGAISLMPKDSNLFVHVDCDPVSTNQEARRAGRESRRSLHLAEPGTDRGDDVAAPTDASHVAGARVVEEGELAL